MLDAPDGETAYGPEDQQEDESRRVDPRLAEVEDNAEHAARDRGHNSDPQPRNGGHEEDGREIGREENVRSDERNPPARRGRQDETDGCKRNAEQDGGLRFPVPSPPEFIEQFHGRPISPISLTAMRPGLAVRFQYSHPI